MTYSARPNNDASVTYVCGHLLPMSLGRTYRGVLLTASKVLAAKLLLQSSKAALVEVFDPNTNGPVSEVK